MPSLSFITNPFSSTKNSLKIDSSSNIIKLGNEDLQKYIYEAKSKNLNCSLNLHKILECEKIKNEKIKVKPNDLPKISIKIGEKNYDILSQKLILACTMTKR